MVEKRCAIFHLFSVKKIKIMDIETEVTNKKQLALTEIKNTPFKHATDGERNYIICGRVLLEKDLDEEQAKKWIETKPWEAIAMLAQSIFHEILNEKQQENGNN